MKILQTRSSIILVLFISLIGSSILAGIPISSAQEDTQIPGWIKNVASWWANGEISENEFLTGIEYLINNNIISISFIPCSIITEDQNVSSSTGLVPNWVKNNAKWWSEDLIGDTDFINGLDYLIEGQIIKIDNKKILGKVPLEDIKFSDLLLLDKNNLVFIRSAFFEVYAKADDCLYGPDGVHLKWRSLALGINLNNLDRYNEVALWNDPQKTVVVFPFFTHSAYSEPGFYTYFRGECDDCTTTKITAPTLQYTSSGNAYQSLNLLGYPSITDIDVDKDPSILQQFDKVIMLHNEYVTRAMFDAITSHPNVIYLYPNALYAEIEVNYVDETITLIRGHDYPPEDPVTNGFDWEFDNTHPYEFDSLCAEMEFFKIKNGWMTTCYPENIFVRGEQLFQFLKVIKDL